MAQSSPSATLTSNSPAALAPGGGSVLLTVRIVFSGTPSAVGWTVTIPPGWSYAGGTDEPGVKPSSGQSDTLEWAWTSIPTSPAQFTFNVSYPAGTSGGTISALATYRENSTLQQIGAGTLAFSAASVNTPPTIAQSPASQTVTAGQSATFAVAATGRPAPGYQWQRKPAGSSLWSNLADGGNFAGATAAILTVSTTTTAMSGDQFQCVVSNGVPPNAISSVAALLVSAAVIVPPTAAPTIVTQPASQTITAGNRVVFAVTTTGQASFSYQWSKDGVALAGATDSVFVLANAQPGDAGDYTVVVSNSANRINSAVATLTVNYARLTSVSVRSGAGTGDQTLIVGFAINGSAAKQMLIRGVGPALTQYGVSGVLADPQLKLFNSASVQIGQNDDWGGDAALSAVFTRTGAFALPPTSKDAAMLTPLAGGSYTAYITAAAGTGVALLEAYDADTGTPASRVVSISARAMAGQGDNTLIVGFAISGTENKTLLIRGVGPTLTQYGVSGVLADPQLKLFNSAGVQIGQNDDWGGDAALSAAFTRTGAFALPTTSKDAALLTPLTGGSYTAYITAAAGTGVALLEAYDADAGTPASRVAGISARAMVGQGDNILIVGFAISGTENKTLLIRGVGPTLTQYGVSGVLADPQLKLFNQQGQELQENSDWGGGAALANAFTQTYAFALPAASKDAAMLVTLAPGVYTAQVNGVGNTTGIALIEVYEIP